MTKPFARIGQIRSSGITDLRCGHVLAVSWQCADRFQRSVDQREPLPLPPATGPAAANCYTVAATTSEKPGDSKDLFFVDGLIPVRSALGLYDELRHTLAFAPKSQWIVSGIGHMALLRRLEVARRLLGWLYER